MTPIALAFLDLIGERKLIVFSSLAPSLDMETELAVALKKIYTLPALKACPIETTFKILGKKWTVLIVREMLLGVRQFNRIQERVNGINPKMLSLRLKELRRASIVKRRIVSSEPVKIEYELTETGVKLLPILAAAADFSMTCYPKVVFEDAVPRSLGSLSS